MRFGLIPLCVVLLVTATPVMSLAQPAQPQTGAAAATAAPQQSTKENSPGETKSKVDQEFGTSDALSYISTLVTIFSILLGIISILFLVVSVFGFREILQFRELEQKIGTLLEQSNDAKQRYDGAASLVDTLLKDFREKSDILREELSKESGKLIEASYHFSLGENCYRKGDFRAAVENYRHALELRPQDDNILIRIGRSLVNIDDTTRAKSAFEDAIAHNPENANAYYGLATVHRYPDIDLAIELAKKGADLKPESVEINNYVGLLCRDANRFDEASKYHQKAIALDNGVAVSHFYLSLLYLRNGDEKLAKVHALTAVVAVERDLSLSAVRPVWAAVIRWAHAVLDKNPALAKPEWETIEALSTTERVRLSVMAHVDFLLASTGASAADFGGKFDDP